MGDAELHGDMEILHVLAVGREIITAQGASCKTPKTSEFLSHSRPKIEGVPGSLLVK
jgi:hypothetical protein